MEEPQEAETKNGETSTATEAENTEPMEAEEEPAVDAPENADQATEESGEQAAEGEEIPEDLEGEQGAEDLVDEEKVDMKEKEEVKAGEEKRRKNSQADEHGRGEHDQDWWRIMVCPILFEQFCSQRDKMNQLVKQTRFFQYRMSEHMTARIWPNRYGPAQSSLAGILEMEVPGVQLSDVTRMLRSSNLSKGKRMRFDIRRVPRDKNKGGKTKTESKPTSSSKPKSEGEATTKTEGEVKAKAETEMKTGEDAKTKAETKTEVEGTTKAEEKTEKQEKTEEETKTEEQGKPEEEAEMEVEEKTEAEKGETKTEGAEEKKEEKEEKMDVKSEVEAPSSEKEKELRINFSVQFHLPIPGTVLKQKQGKKLEAADRRITLSGIPEGVPDCVLRAVMLAHLVERETAEDGTSKAVFNITYGKGAQLYMELFDGLLINNNFVEMSTNLGTLTEARDKLNEVLQKKESPQKNRKRKAEDDSADGAQEAKRPRGENSTPLDPVAKMWLASKMQKEENLVGLMQIAGEMAAQGSYMVQQRAIQKAAGPRRPWVRGGPGGRGAPGRGAPRGTSRGRGRAPFVRGASSSRGPPRFARGASAGRGAFVSPPPGRRGGSPRGGLPPRGAPRGRGAPGRGRGGGRGGMPRKGRYHDMEDMRAQESEIERLEEEAMMADYYALDREPEFREARYSPRRSFDYRDRRW